MSVFCGGATPIFDCICMVALDFVNQTGNLKKIGNMRPFGWARIKARLEALMNE